ncbi:hypothetical protein NKG05_22025 [Oerskovia sp. M15]
MVPKTVSSPSVASRRGPLGSAHRAPVPDARLLDLLDSWLPAQRWYPVKGLAVRHVPWLSFALTDRCTLHLLRIVGQGVDLVIQVPLVLTPAEALAGSTGPGRAPPPARPCRASWGSSGSSRHRRGARRRHASRPLGGPPGRARPRGGQPRGVHGERSGGPRRGPGGRGRAVELVGRPARVRRRVDPQDPAHDRDRAQPGRRGPGRPRARRLDGVPRPLGWVEATWDALDVPSDAVTIGPGRTAHLAVLSELVVDAQDGFELACAYAGQDTSFADLAADLGATLASMHRALREALPTGPPLEAGWLLGDLRRRAREACATSTPSPGVPTSSRCSSTRSPTAWRATAHPPCSRRSTATCTWARLCTRAASAGRSSTSRANPCGPWPSAPAGPAAARRRGDRALARLRGGRRRRPLTALDDDGAHRVRRELPAGVRGRRRGRAVGRDHRVAAAGAHPRQGPL